MVKHHSPGGSPKSPVPQHEITLLDGCWDPSFERRHRWYHDIRRRDIMMAAFILIPLWMFLAWFITPTRTVKVLIIDKTVPNFKYNEHRSAIWFLRHFRFDNGERLYRSDRDYFGFHPLEQGMAYHADNMSAYDSSSLEAMYRHFDAVWITDTYGVYRKDWLSGEMGQERNPLIHGQLKASEAAFIREMKRRDKLILGEFNFIGTPTSETVRRSMEKSFGLHWTGWTGRYFDGLDSNNTDLPRWVIRNYTEQYDTSWHFHNAGLILTHSSERIVVLEEGNQMSMPLPEVRPTALGLSLIPDLPPSVYYPFWFDINTMDSSLQSLADYTLHISSRGDSLLRALGIPRSFPAVLRSRDGLFYYSAGDVGDTRVRDWTAHFKGIQYFRGFFYKAGDEVDRDQFFWEFSYPLMRHIFNDYHHRLQTRKNVELKPENP